MTDVIIGEYIKFERPVGYRPIGYLTVEDEIRDIFDKEKRLIEKIVKFDGYIVYCSKKLRKDTYQKIKGLSK